VDGEVEGRRQKHGFFKRLFFMRQADLTKSQQKTLGFIERFADAEGRSPTLKDIAEGVGCAAVSTVHKHVRHLIEKGFLERRRGRGNNIVCTIGRTVARAGLPGAVPMDGADGADWADWPEAPDGGGGARAFPYYGDVAAGQPMAPGSYAVPTEVPRAIHRNKENLFVLRVRGDSMADDSILDGDMVVLQRRDEYRNGDRVVALIDREEATLKELRRDGDGVWLIPHNPEFAPRRYSPEQVDVQGVLVGVMRSC
jgi:SOS regulatory protein LexA